MGTCSSRAFLASQDAARPVDRTQRRQHVPPHPRHLGPAPRRHHRVAGAERPPRPRQHDVPTRTSVRQHRRPRRVEPGNTPHQVRTPGMGRSGDRHGGPRSPLRSRPNAAVTTPRRIDGDAVSKSPFNRSSCGPRPPSNRRRSPVDPVGPLRRPLLRAGNAVRCARQVRHTARTGSTCAAARGAPRLRDGPPSNVRDHLAIMFVLASYATALLIGGRTGRWLAAGVFPLRRRCSRR